MKQLISILLFLTICIYGWAQIPVNQVIKYRDVGPTRGGRSTAVAGIASQPNVFFMGATGGGLWKSDDYGQNWRNISDGYFGSPSIGAIKVAPSDPQTIYVGTGSDGIRSNIISGDGIYSSANGGKTWTHLGLKETFQIGAIEVHPKNKDIVYVAAIGNPFAKNSERGIFKTTDGGNTWKNVLYHSDSVGFADLEIAPDNPEILYAAAWQVERKPWTIKSGPVGGFYRSVDGGNTWKSVTNGLPTGLVGKMDLAVSASDPKVVYVLVEALPGSGLYRSDDYGVSFSFVSNQDGLLDRPFYYCNVDVNPQNANTVFVNSTRYHFSYDGGKTWRTARTPHGDNHDMWINPNDTTIYIQSNDGGANVTLNYGRTWSSQENQPTAELYQVEVDDQYPYWLYAGQQDNTTIAVPSDLPYSSPGGATAFWMEVGGCETGPAVPKPGNPNIVYSNCKGRFGVYNKTTGQEKQYYVGAANIYGHHPDDLEYRFQRVAPIHVSPHNSDKVYHGSQYLHVTYDDGVTWQTISPDLTARTRETQVISGTPITRDATGEEYYSTIYSIRESPVKAGIIWVGANDGPVHVTFDDGKTWNNVTPSNLPSGGRIDSVEPSPHDANTAYITSLRYQLGDWKPYIFKTTDGGKSWDLIVSGIGTGHPVRVVREHPSKKGLLFAGTEFGIYYSTDSGNSWKTFQHNLPVTPVTDLKIKNDDLVLSTMGRGFWILDNVSVIVDLLSRINSDLYITGPNQVYSSRNWVNPAQVPQYSPPGIDLHYTLSQSVPAKLEIYSSAGQLVNSFESADRNNPSSSSTSMATGFRSRSGGNTLSNKQGLNVFHWDLTHSGPINPATGQAGSGGPLVSPGIYKAVITSENKNSEFQFEVLADPRVISSGISVSQLKEQEEFSLKVRDLLSTARKVSNRVQKEHEIALKSKKTAKRANGLAALIAKLETAEGTYMQPMLTDQISYLNSMSNRADQLPGKETIDRYEELKEILDVIIAELEKSFKITIEK